MSDPSAAHVPSSPPNDSRRVCTNNATPSLPPPYAFLVHSPNTVANDLPPDVDNKPLARQKRRRTSKEDEEILKTEYLKNPKPDKAARIQIVRKVALGEKEVQIWFQNKRQNDRRRARPLEPSSTASLLSSSSNMSDPVTDDERVLRDGTDAHTEPHNDDISALDDPANLEDAEPTVTSEDAEITATATVAATQEQNSEDVVVIGEVESQATVDSVAIAIASTDPATIETAVTEPDSSQQESTSSQSAERARTSWISNRRSASFRHGEDYAPEVITFPQPTSTAADEAPPSITTSPAEAPPKSSTPKKSLKRTHSFVRLSMTDDGTARVITDADKTPSPPHAKSNPASLSRAAAGLRRSYSSAGLNERLAAASRGEPSPKMPRTSSSVGRSRDSRAWEFWCDPDTRNSRSLTTWADQEGSGSAADAIGLLRANRRVLGQNQTRQNTPIMSRHNSSKSTRDGGVKKSRRQMQRASTISGPLPSKETKHGDSSESDELPQTESDKENWEPELPQARRQRTSGPQSSSQRPRQILGENTEIMSQSTSLGAMLAKEKGSRRERGTSDPEADEELQLFMNSSDTLSGRTSLSSAEEAGCVEGLLKLSQGNWR
ncbi:hypothetical protein BU24DRAFT_423674 [Aaosphaeria arxii CBS 175.79]|uniref:Homeobox domain-containing protein n=1 Tax=Aaosphaeria arxii CBS 175.79 TaxID=1450172 RepID=A0A6A5XPE5_9PLEO|nr:uncharacterized protein BU24DRAFT_423674 [Aaosphaeria arxii CBS 175.79]KAF2014776.1 hypothetical protein BU24DRAFT_423674 [Aaosphaeria arxii CBS 175.79]